MPEILWSIFTSLRMHEPESPNKTGPCLNVREYMDNADTRRLIIVSNRLPVTAEKKKGGITFKQSVGGLATGLNSFYQSKKSLWIGWCGIARDSLSTQNQEEISASLMRDFKSLPVSLSRKDIKLFYHGFSNRTIWPLFHYFPNYTVYDRNLWEAYERVNIKFRDEVLKSAGSEDTIWIHDYQLMLLPRLIRERLPEAEIGFFLHIPFPSFEIFRLFPWRDEILKGLLGSDLIGFHTYDYVRHFLSSVRRLLGYDHTLGQLLIENRIVKAEVFPMGIDYERYARAGQTPKVKREVARIKKRLGGRKTIISIDRLDYTKGILHRLAAFDHFLKTNTGFLGNVTLILVAVPSRTSVETYAQLKKELDEQVGRINGKYGTMSWIPVWYLYRSLPFNTLVSLYSVADAALVTPLRDGMNLIAKEYIAARGDSGGVLILSGLAGAVHELSEAVVVNPNNIEQVASAIVQALQMPLEEQVERNRVMQYRIRRYNVERWAEDFLERLEAVRTQQKELCVRKLTRAARKKLLYDYCKAETRLLLLDYDGTLVRFVAKPEKARPDSTLLSIIGKLAGDKKNEVVIISGRDRETLKRWFGDIHADLVAEHGVWIREKEGEEIETEALREEWKEAIRPIFELYMDRTPGSLIEEKRYSLAWHYRLADPDLASVRITELRETLLHLTENMNIGLLEGNKVMEVRAAGVTKGRAAMHWLSGTDWDFIAALGDDVTDEDTFDVLPSGAYSIKIGLGATRAHFSVLDVDDARNLLAEIAGENI